MPEGAKSEDGSVLHDDLLTAAVLCTQLDAEPWLARSETVVIRSLDPLREMDRGWVRR